MTASTFALDGDRLDLEVDYTTSKPVDGLPGLGAWIWKLRVPVNAIWRLLPWNDGPPTASVRVTYLDADFRVVEDGGGEVFCYCRPLLPS